MLVYVLAGCPALRGSEPLPQRIGRFPAGARRGVSIANCLDPVGNYRTEIPPMDGVLGVRHPWGVGGGSWEILLNT